MDMSGYKMIQLTSKQDSSTSCKPTKWPQMASKPMLDSLCPCLCMFVFMIIYLCLCSTPDDFVRSAETVKRFSIIIVEMQKSSYMLASVHLKNLNIEINHSIHTWQGTWSRVVALESTKPLRACFVRENTTAQFKLDIEYI